MGRKRTTDYVNNKELKELLVYWLEHNPNETGEWLDKYEKTITKKRGIDENTAKWIKKRRELYATPRKMTPEFRICERKLFEAVYKIVQGRVACFQFKPEEKEDLIQEIMLTEVKYLTRYNELMDTSAFAYVTSICSNAIKLYLGNDNASRFCRIPWNELSDSHIALMYGVAENSDNSYD